MNLIPQAKSIMTLLDAAGTATSDVLLPAIDLLETSPISGLKAGDGFDVKLLWEYLDFAQTAMPKLEQLMEAVNAIDLSLLDSDGRFFEYLEPVNEFLEVYHEDPAIFSMFKAMLGAEDDRLYLIAVQNPSEIRASGGFPGFMDTLHIKDGILTVGEFKSVTKF